MFNFFFNGNTKTSLKTRKRNYIMKKNCYIKQGLSWIQKEKLSMPEAFSIFFFFFFFFWKINTHIRERWLLDFNLPIKTTRIKNQKGKLARNNISSNQDEI